MITPKDKIGFIRRLYDEKQIPHFRFIVSKINRVIIGKKGTRIYSDKFNPLDEEEIESNTRCIDTSKGILIVNEPFIVKDEEIAYFEAVCDRWNQTPPKSIFD